MKYLVCPLCHRRYDNPPAMSRKNNKTEICPECGLKEAIIQFIQSKK